MEGMSIEAMGKEPKMKDALEKGRGERRRMKTSVQRTTEVRVMKTLVGVTDFN